jgi:hypothetical protein
MPTPSPEEADDTDSTTPAEDIQMRETQRILADYIRLLSEPAPSTLTQR